MFRVYHYRKIHTRDAMVFCESLMFENPSNKWRHSFSKLRRSHGCHVLVFSLTQEDWRLDWMFVSGRHSYADTMTPLALFSAGMSANNIPTGRCILSVAVCVPPVKQHQQTAVVLRLPTGMPCLEEQSTKHGYLFE